MRREYRQATTGDEGAADDGAEPGAARARFEAAASNRGARQPGSSLLRASPSQWARRLILIGLVCILVMHWHYSAHKVLVHEERQGQTDMSRAAAAEDRVGGGSGVAVETVAVETVERDPKKRREHGHGDHIHAGQKKKLPPHRASATATAADAGGGGEGAQQPGNHQLQRAEGETAVGGVEEAARGSAGAPDEDVGTRDEEDASELTWIGAGGRGGGGAGARQGGVELEVAGGAQGGSDEDVEIRPGGVTPRARKQAGGGRGSGRNGRKPGHVKGAVGKVDYTELSFEVEEGREWGSPSGSFGGNFVMNAAKVEPGDPILFPRKKMRNQLTHYSLGKVTRQLHMLLPPDDPVRRRRRSGRCAVVGNGGSLLLWELGREIDAHDVVLRLNAGPTKGFEKHVGSRTTYRMVNRLHIGFRESEEEVVLQHVSTAEALAKFAELRVLGLSLHPNFYMLDMDWHEFAYNHTDKGVLSNGFYGLLLASEMCKQVSMYGFLREWRGSTHYHYYNKQEPDFMQSKRDNKEEERLSLFINSRPHTHRWGEPCMGYSMGGCTAPCEGCTPGAGCQCGVWHPVPLRGYCYGGQHAMGKGVPDIGCMHRCEQGHDDDICRGGVNSTCLESAHGEVWGDKCVL